MMRVTRPVLLKFGVMLAFSLGGILFSFFKTRRIKPRARPSSPKSEFSPEHRNNEGDGCDDATTSTEVNNDEEDPLVHKTFSSCRFASIIPPGAGDDSTRSSINDNNGCYNFTPSGSSKSIDVYLLPKFNNVVKEFDMSAIKAPAPRKLDEQVVPVATDEKVDQDVEIRILRNTINTLKEREKSLEIQLIECHGIKEQETAVMELQNRLKINNIEARLFNLKIENLQADKRRLEEHVGDHAKVMFELEAAKAKIKLLKKKQRSEAEQNKGHIFTLQERLVKLQDQGNTALLTSDDRLNLKSQRIKELEDEAMELTNSNNALKEENSSFAQKLDYLQNLATSLLEDEQSGILKEENRLLRQKNEDMSIEIERLQSDRCTDIEELVYLRWINACLRYELRNYQPGTGKTTARDLSKTLSPKSEEKAKHLILEYAQKEGTGEKSMIATPDFYSDQWSSSQSNPTDCGEYDDSSVDLSLHGNNSHVSRKSKVLGKLMKLLRGGKQSNRYRKGLSLDASPQFDERSSSEVLNVKSGTSSRRSLDLPRSPYIHDSRSNKGDSNAGDFQRNSSDGSSSSISKVIGTISQHTVKHLPDQDPDDAQKSNLLKYAAALSTSNHRISPNGRLTSYSSF